MFEGYESVNKQFAQKVAALSKPGDIIWAHDYHLLTFARHLRDMGVKERIGFFLHIPFPVPEIFAALPYYMDIIRGICSYDVVGFQTEPDVQAFLRCISDLAGGRVSKTLHENMYEVQVFGRTFKAGCFSISIDTHDLMLAADRAAISPKTQQLKDSLQDRALLIGVDRLDYTKGLIQRLESYSELLKKYPEYRGKVSYVQITPPSRGDVEIYENIRNDMESLAARINGTNADIDWVPLRYINKSFTRDELSGFYRTAKVGLVTPLRDGMNLVAKEYVASQDPGDPGVLLLSRFAGAAHELGCGAILINPYNTEETALQMHRALCMPLEERKERYDTMIAVLKHNDIFLWYKRFLDHLTHANEKDKIIVWQQRYPNVVSVSVPKKVPVLITQNL
jgi:trehalose 6-phosphate synthase